MGEAKEEEERKRRLTDSSKFAKAVRGFN